MKPGVVFPKEGLGGSTPPTQGCLAVKCIKLLCKHAIHLAVMDEASAIDGSRPLEQVADACGIAWGSTNVQMLPDLTGFKVLLMTGKGFTPAQQAWPALTLEAFAQLGGKRAQKKILGPMRTLHWTDHANFTKQQHVELAEIEPKHLRWLSEVVADGSEVRSLAGRSARLGDGTSRNPGDRDQLLEQRTTELTGIAGQIRNFNLNEFLSDWEEPGVALPWALGDGAWVKDVARVEQAVQGLDRWLDASDMPSDWADGVGRSAALGTYSSLSRFPQPTAEEEPKDLLNLAFVMASEGVMPKVKVLYVPDYTTSAGYKAREYS